NAARVGVRQHRGAVEDYHVETAAPAAQQLRQLRAEQIRRRVADAERRHHVKHGALIEQAARHAGGGLVPFHAAAFLVTEFEQLFQGVAAEVRIEQERAVSAAAETVGETFADDAAAARTDGGRHEDDE